MDKDLTILSCLRENGRIPLTTLAHKTGLPVSTVFDRLRATKTITRHTTLLNYPTLGYTAHALVLLRTHKKDKQAIQKHLETNPNVNTLNKINNGYDYAFDCIFRTMNELESFLENLEEKYTIKTTVHYLIHELKRETFLSNPDTLHLL